MSLGAAAGSPARGQKPRAQQQPLTLQQQLQQAQATLQLLHAQQQQGSSDMEKTRQLLQSVKAFVALAALETIHDPNLVKAVALAGRDCFELAAFFTVAEMQQMRRSRPYHVGGMEEEEETVEGDEFERYMMMLLPYYMDYAALLPPSKHRSELLCLHLLHYLASNRIGEFHMALEALPPDVRGDSMTQQVLQLEQHLIDGSYGELLHPKRQQQEGGRGGGEKAAEEEQSSSSVAALKLPPSAQVFIDKLLRTVRLKVAACMEKAHSSVDAAYAMQALGLSSTAELEVFVTARNSSSQQQDVFMEYLPPAASGTEALTTTATGGRGTASAAAAAAAGGEGGSNAAPGNALAAAVGSGSFTSAASFTAAVEPKVLWRLDRGTLTFIKKEETSAQAQQHCSLQAMQLLGNLISKEQQHQPQTCFQKQQQVPHRPAPPTAAIHRCSSIDVPHTIGLLPGSLIPNRHEVKALQGHPATQLNWSGSCSPNISSGCTPLAGKRLPAPALMGELPMR